MEDEIEYIYDEDDSMTADKHVWDRPMTLCLIEEYRNHLQDFLYPDGRMIRDIWEIISLNMHAKGYAVSAGSCDQKWRQLKKTFKFNQKMLCKRPKTKWVYYDALKDIIEEKTKRASWKQRSTVKQEPNSSSHYTQSDDEDISLKTVTAKEEKPPKWFELFYTQYQEEEQRKRKMLQKMHSDLVALERQKCVLLQNLIKKIPKPTPVPKIIDAISLSQEVFEDDEKLSYSFNSF